MSSKIQVLENSMINKIAAGEVVERPVSVVKELVENSIDAGASTVTVEIKDGGISYIRISDNGRGIPKDELKTAFLRHATSKIRNFDDLTNVLTLGFRGEALSSISSVSQVEMVTKTADALSGAKIEIDGGQIISFADTGATIGSTIIIRNLFYNIPARRKFLKKAATEAGYIHELIQRLALAHSEISFKLINNNQNVISTNGNGDLKTAVYYIYGKDISKKLIEVGENAGKIKLSGFVCAPEAARGNRSYGNFFINGRYIKSPIVQSAVEDAFKNRLMTGKFPVYILNLKIEPGCVDVNVHPSKLEVRFENEDEIFSIVVNAVKKALDGGNLITEVKWDGARQDKKAFVVEDSGSVENISVSDLIYGGAKSSGKINVAANSESVIKAAEETDKMLLSKEHTEQTLIIEAAENKPEESSGGGRAFVHKPSAGDIERILRTPSGALYRTDDKTSVSKKEEIFSDYIIAGQIFDTYWIITQKDKMYLIDQHAAHERVLYEEYLEKFTSGGVPSQLLIEPISVRLAPVETETAKDNMELFLSFGFELEEFGEDIFMIRALPYIFSSPTRAEFFVEIVDTLAGFNGNKSSLYEFKRDAIASMSCKAAVKANAHLSESECHTLIERLLKLENPFTCPHGRPTIISMSKYEIEKKFGRK